MRLAVGYYGVLVIASGGGPLRKRRSGSIDKPPQWGGSLRVSLSCSKDGWKGLKILEHIPGRIRGFDEAGTVPCLRIWT